MASPFHSLGVLLAGCITILCDLQVHAAPNSRWTERTDSDTVFVFVHGVLSDSGAAWTHRDGTFWPALLFSDTRFDRPNVYVAGYPTSLSDPNFGIEDAALHLFGRLNGTGPQGEPPVLLKNQIIFVAHSTGGLAVREMLIHNYEAFRTKQIGLFLLASPSRGSEWADRAQGLSSLLGHKMLAELESNSDFIVNLDKQFSELLARRKIWMIAGMDVFESRFVVPGWLWNQSRVVNPDASHWYFGEPRQVPFSDHFSISKPSTRSQVDTDQMPHEYLWEFYEQRFKPEISALSRCAIRETVRYSKMEGSIHERSAARTLSIPSLITLAQLTGDSVPSNIDEACLRDRLASLRHQRTVLSEGGVRCEGGGIKARGEQRTEWVAYDAPPNAQIVGQVDVQRVSDNRGTVGAIEYSTREGKTVGFKMPVTCESPSIAFGPGAWMQVRVLGTIEREPTQEEKNAARDACTR